MSESRNAPEQTPEPHRSAAAAAEAQWRKVESQLDDALADTFPASDPVSIVTSHQEEDGGRPAGK